METAAFEKVLPRDFYEALLNKQSRYDGRSNGQRRTVRRLNAGLRQWDGSCLVHWGNTVALAGAQAKVALPRPDALSTGFISFSLATAPVLATALSLLLERHISHSSFSLDSLCITPGEAVWHIEIHAQLLHDDGSAICALFLAALDAIRSLSLPALSMKDDEGQVSVHIDPSQPPKRMDLPHSVPLSLRLVTGQSGPVWMVDLSRSEAAALNGADFFVLLDLNAVPYFVRMISDPGSAPEDLGLEWLARKDLELDDDLFTTDIDAQKQD